MKRKRNITIKNLLHLACTNYIILGLVVIVFMDCVFVANGIRDNESSLDIIGYVLMITQFFGTLVAGAVLYYRYRLNKHIRIIKEDTGIDAMEALADKELSVNNIYKDEEWFVAVTPPEIILLNKKCYCERLEKMPRNGYTELKLFPNNRKEIEYSIEYKWNHTIKSLEKWIKNK